MIKRKDFSNNLEFMNYNKSVIHDNYFVFYASLMSMLAPSMQIVRLYNLYDKKGYSAYCMWYSGNYAIHAFNWNEELLEAISDEIEFERYKHFTFSGQRDLIIQMLEDNEVPYQIIKDRLIYACTTVLPFALTGQVLVQATETDTEELSAMAYQYHLDEYGTEAQRSREHMAEIVINGIQEGIMYKLVVDGETTSMAQVISHNFKSPLIGMLFTKATHRNKGYGYAILVQLTSQLLAGGHKKVGLLADTQNPASLKIFEKAGYKEIYKHILVAIGEDK
jgi:GNAT superfamily N-acetyltransferase